MYFHSDFNYMTFTYNGVFLERVIDTFTSKEYDDFLHYLHPMMVII